MNNIPKSVIVFVAFFLGISAIILTNPPYSQCHSQLEILRKNLEGDIFTRAGKKINFSPRLNRHIEICKVGNGPGGCYELFSTLRKLTRELRNFPNDCGEELAEVAEVQRALKEGIMIMVQLAWGETPPASAEARFRWLEPADLALFCELRDMTVKIFGMEDFENFRTGVLGRLPGELPMFSEGQCVNCEFRKPAVQILKPDEVWKRSLFSTACNGYR